MRPVPHGFDGEPRRTGSSGTGRPGRDGSLLAAGDCQRAECGDLDEIALPYAAKVIRELFMNSAEAGAWA